MNQSSTPPLASPHGSGEPLSVLQENGNKRVARLAVSLSTAATLRYAAIEWLSPGNLGTIFGVPLVVTLPAFALSSRYNTWANIPSVYFACLVLFVVFSACLVLLVRLCSRRKFEIEISPLGLFKLYPSRNIHFAWSKFWWILERNGDLWIASLVDGCFIPRESFSSRQESHEFADMVRSLKRSNGADWQETWNERAFGIQPGSIH